MGQECCGGEATNAKLLDEDTDVWVDYVRQVLKAQYQLRLQEAAARLRSFEAVNWDGAKRRLREHVAMISLPAGVNSPVLVSELRMQAIVAWMEEVLAP